MITKALEYYLVQEDYVSFFNTAINQKLKEQFSLFGDTFMEGKSFCQALIREEALFENGGD